MKNVWKIIKATAETKMGMYSEIVVFNIFRGSNTGYKCIVVKGGECF